MLDADMDKGNAEERSREDILNMHQLAVECDPHMQAAIMLSTSSRLQGALTAIGNTFCLVVIKARTLACLEAWARLDKRLTEEESFLCKHLMSILEHRLVPLKALTGVVSNENFPKGYEAVWHQWIEIAQMRLKNTQQENIIALGGLLKTAKTLAHIKYLQHSVVLLEKKKYNDLKRLQVTVKSLQAFESHLTCPVTSLESFQFLLISITGFLTDCRAINLLEVIEDVVTMMINIGNQFGLHTADVKSCFPAELWPMVHSQNTKDCKAVDAPLLEAKLSAWPANVFTEFEQKIMKLMPAAQKKPNIYFRSVEKHLQANNNVAEIHRLTSVCSRVNEFSFDTAVFEKEIQTFNGPFNLLQSCFQLHKDLKATECQAEAECLAEALQAFLDPVPHNTNFVALEKAKDAFVNALVLKAAPVRRNYMHEWPSVSLPLVDFKDKLVHIITENMSIAAANADYPLAAQLQEVHLKLCSITADSVRDHFVNGFWTVRDVMKAAQTLIADWLALTKNMPALTDAVNAERLTIQSALLKVNNDATTTDSLEIPRKRMRTKG